MYSGVKAYEKKNKELKQKKSTPIVRLISKVFEILLGDGYERVEQSGRGSTIVSVFFLFWWAGPAVFLNGT